MRVGIQTLSDHLQVPYTQGTCTVVEQSGVSMRDLLLGRGGALEGRQADGRVPK